MHPDWTDHQTWFTLWTLGLAVVVESDRDRWTIGQSDAEGIYYPHPISESDALFLLALSREEVLEQLAAAYGPVR